MSNTYQGIEDNYLPSVPKPSLQQYDNYQIHDLYCEDIIYGDAIQTTSRPPTITLRNFLAVESFSPFGAIECNFNAIASMYP